jgi:outer membrane lipoprotein-sorting protein
MRRNRELRMKKRIWTRWIPAVLAPIVVASSVALSGGASAVDLPDKSAAEILAMINTNPDLAFSGRVMKKADMGLPPMNLVPDISQSMVDSMREKLPAEMADFIPEASIEGPIALALEFLGGVHRANLYVDGAKKARLQVLDLISERNFIRNGNDLWFYDAMKNHVIYGEVDPAREASAQSEIELWLGANSAQLPFDITSPASVAQYLIDQASESTLFEVEEDIRVAGRGAYQLVMLPKASGSLVDRVELAIDAETGLPLSVKVRAIGQSAPAFEVGFETISFAKPAAANFEFTVPSGATLEKLPTADELEALAEREAGKKNVPAKEISEVEKAEVIAEFERMRSEGWAAISKIPADKVPAEFEALLKENRLFKELTRSVAGGRVFSTALFNIYFADSGAIFAGAVTVDTLLNASNLHASK